MIGSSLDRLIYNAFQDATQIYEGPNAHGMRRKPNGTVKFSEVLVRQNSAVLLDFPLSHVCHRGQLPKLCEPDDHVV
jgi:hypothetical protein